MEYWYLAIIVTVPVVIVVIVLAVLWCLGYRCDSYKNVGFQCPTCQEFINHVCSQVQFGVESEDGFIRIVTDEDIAQGKLRWIERPSDGTQGPSTGYICPHCAQFISHAHIFRVPNDQITCLNTSRERYTTVDIDRPQVATEVGTSSSPCDGFGRNRFVNTGSFPQDGALIYTIHRRHSWHNEISEDMGYNNQAFTREQTPPVHSHTHGIPAPEVPWSPGNLACTGSSSHGSLAALDLPPSYDSVMADFQRTKTDNQYRENNDGFKRVELQAVDVNK